MSNLTLTVTLDCVQLEFAGDFVQNFTLTVVHSGLLEFAGETMGTHSDCQ
jgi:hypothetical protein